MWLLQSHKMPRSWHPGGKYKFSHKSQKWKTISHRSQKNKILILAQVTEIQKILHRSQKYKYNFSHRSQKYKKKAHRSQKKTNSYTSHKNTNYILMKNNKSKMDNDKNGDDDRRRSLSIRRRGTSGRCRGCTENKGVHKVNLMLMWC